MRSKLLFAALSLALFSTAGCIHTVLFWRATLIQGQTRLVRQDGTPVANAPSVNVNFINLGGRIEDSVISAQSDALGKYRSAKLIPGKYTVEAMLPGYVIARTVVEVKSHEYKRVDFVLQQIGESEGLSLKEAESDNIRAPGQVQIGRPKF